MNEDALKRELRELHRKLERTQVNEGETRELLRELAGDIDRALADGEHQGLAERLRIAVALFEAEHPDLALLTARVIDQLVKLGI